jgi:ABC-type transporter Mla subunit MlaD
MKIRRFSEDNQSDISSERIEEVLSDLKDFASNISERSKSVESLLNELSNFKGQSKKGNDQIDDSIASLQIIKKDLDDCLDKLDTVASDLTNYNENGRKYLYTEK